MTEKNLGAQEERRAGAGRPNEDRVHGDAPQGCRMVYLCDTPPAVAPEMLAEEPELLNVQDLSRLTGLSKQTIRAEIHAGRLPGCRIGRRLFVPKVRFVEYVTGEAAGPR